MIPFFEDNDTWKRMETIIHSWIGTPYRHLTMVKGRGADCTLFIGACFMEIGIISTVKYEYYPRGWHTHTKEERVLDSFVEHWTKYKVPGLLFEAMGVNERKMRGDLLAFSTTKQKVTNHTAIYLEETDRGLMMCHSIAGRGVSNFPYGNFWQRKLTKFFRVYREN